MAEITEDMIGCLCWFGHRHTIGHDKIGFLKIITEIKETKKRYYSNEFGETFDRCRPVKPDEVKFYRKHPPMMVPKAVYTSILGEKAELEQRVQMLEEENKKLKERLADASKTIYTHKGKKISASEYYQRKAEEE